jgi:hypothetical protein
MLGLGLSMLLVCAPPGAEGVNSTNGTNSANSTNHTEMRWYCPTPLPGVAIPFYIRPVYSLFCGDGLWKGLQSPATSTPGPKLNKTDGGEAPPKPEKEDPGPGRDPGSGFWMWAEGWTNSAGKHFHFVFAAFSDYANPGSLSTGGGYLGYLYDQVGLKCLGDWWPYVGA